MVQLTGQTPSQPSIQRAATAAVPAAAGSAGAAVGTRGTRVCRVASGCVGVHPHLQQDLSTLCELHGVVQDVQ
jgi:hypothetical protein